MEHDNYVSSSEQAGIELSEQTDEIVPNGANVDVTKEDQEDVKGNEEEDDVNDEQVGNIARGDNDVTFDDRGATKEDMMNGQTGDRDTGLEVEVNSLADSEKGIVKEESEHGDGGTEREGWDRKADFILACIGYAVGLGNIWRFPYLCYKNGGGAFLIPYVICLILLGIPMFYLEIGLGQYLQLGGLSVWQVVPAFKGVGYGSATIACILNIYYIVIISWVNVYLVFSFFPTLPWTVCDESWNDIYCYDSKTMNTTNNGTEFITGEYNNITIDITEGESPSVQFWNNFVLQISDGINDIDGVVWYLAISLFIAWLLTYACIVKGVKTTGKIVWFTTSFPYVVLTILLVRAVTLPGASDGIYFYLVPDLEKLLEAQVWVDAGSQIFFSLGIGFAGLISLGSYNKYNNNILIDTLIVCSVNCLTSFYAGFMVFGTLGYMAYDQGKEVSEVVEQGPGLTFVVVPTAIAEMPGAQFFAVCFFLMLLLLGLDSQFCVVEGFYTCISDEYPGFFRKHRAACLAVLCVIYYFLALPCITGAGMYFFELMNNYGAGGYVLLWSALWECIAICYGWGIKNFMRGLTDMLGYTPVFIWPACWCVICPVLLTAIFLFSFVSYSGAYYENYKYPLYGEVLGWLMAAVSMHWVLTYFIYFLTISPGSFKQRWITGLTTRPGLELKGQEPEEPEFVKVAIDSITENGPKGTYKSLESDTKESVTQNSHDNAAFEKNEVTTVL
ncbi:sodium- and chloride-dependent GABA transporter 1-like [Glandiceps talaboti]